MNISSLNVLIGPPGCGKSTFARRHFYSEDIVSLDIERERICGDPGNQRATEYAVSIMHPLLAGRCAFRRTTVLDNTSAKRVDRLSALAAAKQHPNPIPTVAIVFTTPLDVCVVRNAERPANRRVPREKIEEMRETIDRDLPPGVPADGFNFTCWVDVDGRVTVYDPIPEVFAGASWLRGARTEVRS
ncbi:AAA family ATPase [Plantactinospora sp. S1510]|uniref:AAA family ATPase n=1 Tax=Plantactinospora alkalitolerans TaxID=2789879 RepID=A0ABS0HB22_9ACTN|nr:ATP-binding protein [Plantactinospora alkalitolerans]MBF9135354.1 AAA family ATPase [Plantactinospora alkalitolerans]